MNCTLNTKPPKKLPREMHQEEIKGHFLFGGVLGNIFEDFVFIWNSCYFVTNGSN